MGEVVTRGGDPWTDMPRAGVGHQPHAVPPPIGELLHVNPAGDARIFRATWDGTVWRHKGGNLVTHAIVQWRRLGR